MGKRALSTRTSKLVFKIRCSGKLHRITYDGKSWSTPDHKSTNSVINALADSADKCPWVMNIIRKNIYEHQVPGMFSSLKAGTQDLKNFVRLHTALRYQKITLREHSRRMPHWFESHNRISREARYELALKDLFKGWLPALSKLLGVTKYRLAVGKAGFISVSGAYAYINIPYELAKDMVYKPCEFKDNKFYVHTKNGTIGFSLNRTQRGFDLVDKKPAKVDKKKEEFVKRVKKQFGYEQLIRFLVGAETKIASISVNRAPPGYSPYCYTAISYKSGRSQYLSEELSKVLGRIESDEDRNTLIAAAKEKVDGF